MVLWILYLRTIYYTIEFHGIRTEIVTLFLEYLYVIWNICRKLFTRLDQKFIPGIYSWNKSWKHRQNAYWILKNVCTIHSLGIAYNYLTVFLNRNEVFCIPYKYFEITHQKSWWKHSRYNPWHNLRHFT